MQRNNDGDNDFNGGNDFNDRGRGGDRSGFRGGRGRGGGGGSRFSGERRPRRDFSNAEIIKNRLMISNLNYTATPDDIRSLVESFGAITDINLPSSTMNANQNRGFGFVTFEKDEDCQAAIDKLHDMEFQQRTIKVFNARNVQRNENQDE